MKLVRVGDGETISRGERREVQILTEQGDVTITWTRYSPGERGPDLHIHREHTDAFYVLDGELTLELGADSPPVRLPAGAFAAVPPNVAHSFVSSGPTDSRWLNLHAPDQGFGAFLRSLRDGTTVPFDSFDAPEDGGFPASDAIVTGPGEGDRLQNGNRVVLLKGVLPDLSAAEWIVEGPFDGPEIHQHDRQVDSFFVLEGELELTVEDAVHTVGPDTLAAVPRGVRHTFAHRGDGTARVLNVHAPDSGFADYLRRTAS